MYICYTETSRPNSERQTHSKLSSQAGKGGLVKWFGEDIGKLVLGGDMGQLDVSFLNVISQEMVPHLYVFGFGVEHWVFGYAYGTGAITQKWDVGEAQAKVSHGLHDPKELGATASGSNILSLCGGLGNARLLARRPRNKRQTQKLTLPRSGFTI